MEFSKDKRNCAKGRAAAQHAKPLKTKSRLKRTPQPSADLKHATPNKQSTKTSDERMKETRQQRTRAEGGRKRRKKSLK